MTRAIAALAIQLTLPNVAHAQQREVYDARPGKSIGRATTDSGGAVTHYASDGRITNRSSISGTTRTFRSPRWRDSTIRLIGSEWPSRAAAVNRKI